MRRLSSKRDAEDAAARLAAEEQIAGDVDRVAERQVLVDHLDARGRASAGEAKATGVAVDLDRAGVGDDGAGQHLAQRRLAGAIVADQPEHLARLQRQVDTSSSVWIAP